MEEGRISVLTVCSLYNKSLLKNTNCILSTIKCYRMGSLNHLLSLQRYFLRYKITQRGGLNRTRRFVAGCEAIVRPQRRGKGSLRNSTLYNLSQKKRVQCWNNWLRICCIINRFGFDSIGCCTRLRTKVDVAG